MSASAEADGARRPRSPRAAPRYVSGEPQGVPVGGLGDAAGVDADGRLVEAQQLLDRSLGLLVGALAEVPEADAPDAIDEVDGRPVVVVERPPDGEVVVDDDRVVDPEFGDRAAYVVEVVLEAELGRVDADDDGPAVAIRSCHALRYGSVRSQLTHEYVQKSMRTSVPRSLRAVSGSELSQTGARSSAESGLWVGWVEAIVISPVGRRRGRERAGRR